MPSLRTVTRAAKAAKKAARGAKVAKGAKKAKEAVSAVKKSARPLSKPLSKPLSRPLRKGRKIGEEIAANAVRAGRSIKAADTAAGKAMGGNISDVVKRELVTGPAKSVKRAATKPSPSSLTTAAVDVAAIAPIPAGKIGKAPRLLKAARGLRAGKSVRTAGRAAISKPVRAAAAAAAGVSLYHRLRGKSGESSRSSSSAPISKAKGLRAVARVSEQKGAAGVRALRSGLSETRRITTTRSGRGSSASEKRLILRSQTALSYLNEQRKERGEQRREKRRLGSKSSR